MSFSDNSTYIHQHQISFNIEFHALLQYDIAKVAALLHRAADLEEVPTMKEVKYLLPKPALTVRDVKPPQWVNMVQSAWPEVASLTSLQAKAQVLGEC